MSHSNVTEAGRLRNVVGTAVIERYQQALSRQNEQVEKLKTKAE